MKKLLCASVLFSALLLSSCNFLPPAKKTNTSGTIPSSGSINPSSDSGDDSEDEPTKEPTVTSVTVSPSSKKAKPGDTFDVSATVIGTNNPSQEVTWTTSQDSVATVSNGTVTVKSTAAAGATATITATSTFDTSKSGKCEITVIDPSSIDAYTLLIYMCGSDLESELADVTSYKEGGKTYTNDGKGFATKDISEIIGCNKPDDVNVVFCTGGATKWTTNSTYGHYSADYDISNSKIQYHHVNGHYIVKDKELTYTSMGDTSTLQSFLTYGLTTYPADKTAVILWNHGGAMMGVCLDEKESTSSDFQMLTNAEVYSAVGAL